MKTLLLFAALLIGGCSAGTTSAFLYGLGTYPYYGAYDPYAAPAYFPVAPPRVTCTQVPGLNGVVYTYCH